MIRGLKLTGVEVGAGHKVGDVDPRQDRALLTEMTDKARAVGRAAVRAAESGGLLPAGAGRALSSPASVREEVP
ncbi:MAG: hypothetical protein HY744_15335 [Deltaproteobacteria bacterium]|nr:hypothetical protein [Deltaproteobacteria bacterium]